MDSVSVKSIEPAAANQWYVIGAASDLPHTSRVDGLLSAPIETARDAEGALIVSSEGRRLPVQTRYGYVWTTLGQPERDVPAIPEAAEPDRRHVRCGTVLVRASGLRIVENFLDMAHFPFVHTHVLGAEPHTEVRHYHTEIRRDVDEVWATDCTFFQPQAAVSAAGGMLTDYIYRVASPFVTLLYKTCPNAADRSDVIVLFVQPLAPDRCRVHPVMFLLDDVSAQSELVRFQQLIFLQDRIILENQRPRLLPLDPRAEIPTRADSASVAYRRWLKEKGVVYGTTGSM